MRNLSIIALAALVITAAAPIALTAEEEKKPAEPALAEVRLRGELSDGRPLELPFGRPPLTYRGLLEILEKAERDDGIRGILLDMRDLDVGLAKLKGIREALAGIRKSGKKVYVYAEELDEKGMLLAAGADRVAMPEGGTVLIPGVAVNVLYLKGLFGLLGIDWFVVQEKEYKTAFESFVRDSMSPEQREVLEGIVAQRYETLVDGISSGRRIPAERVREAIDSGILPAGRARDLGLIDAVEYRESFEEALRKELGGPVAIHKGYGREAKEIDLSNPLALFAQIMKALSPPAEKRKTGRPKLAIIYAEGAIVSGKSVESPFGGPGLVGSETLVEAIDSAASDPSVKAIVLRVDSPGGSGLASDVIWHALRKVGEKKPVIASMSDVAASGGYYIAMAASTIVAEPATITGSIGVIAARPSLSRLLGKWGVRAERIGRGRSAGILDVFHDIGPDGAKALEGYVGGFYKEFVGKVATCRGLPVEDAEKIARGRVWTGAQAKERKLVDELGGFGRAMEIAKAKAGLEPDAAVDVVEYPKAVNLLESLMSGAEMSAFGSAAADLRPFAAAGALPGGRSVLSVLWQIRSLARERVLAILPFSLVSGTDGAMR